MASAWNSLQYATLAVDALTPLTVAGLGYFVARTSRRLEQVQWANQTVVTRRLEIFSEIAPALNKLLCFATFVGRWKEIEGGKAQQAAVLCHLRRPLEGNRATARHRPEAAAGRDDVREPGPVLRRTARRVPRVHVRPVRHVRHHRC